MDGAGGVSDGPLRLVNTETGEFEDRPSYDQLATDLANTTDKLRTAWREVRRLKNEQEDRHRAHKRRSEVESLFELWQELCRHPKSKLDFGPGSRFERLLWGLQTYDYEMCERAIRGAAFDPFTTRRKNGTMKRHDGIELIFRSAEKFEEMANRAPREGGGPNQTSTPRV